MYFLVSWYKVSQLSRRTISRRGNLLATSVAAFIATETQRRYVTFKKLDVSAA